MLRTLRQAASKPLAIPALLALLLAVALGVPSGADAQTLDEIRDQLSETQERQDAIQERITDNQVELEALLGRIAGLEDELAQLEDEAAEHARTLEQLEAMVSFRVREVFKHGASLDPLAVLFAGEDPAASLEMANTVQRLVAADQVRAEDLGAARIRSQASAERLEERRAALAEAEAEFEQAAQQLTEDLESLQTLEASLTEKERAELARIERVRKEREERERRQREAREAARSASANAAASRSSGSSSGSPSGASSGSSGGAAATSSGGTACPLDQPRNFIDSWGYPRSGGRSHRGTDIMGPHGIPVRAITDGIWHHQGYGNSAGVWGILKGSNGHHYWYLHLTSHTAPSGSRVSAGQQIATNGSTGNASAGAPHIHFEVHPGGGSAVNPYPLLRRACG